MDKKSMEKLSAADVKGLLYTQISRPVFVKACADRGIEFDTEKELDQAMKVASVLLELDNQRGTDMLKAAHASFSALIKSAAEEEEEEEEDQSSLLRRLMGPLAVGGGAAGLAGLASMAYPGVRAKARSAGSGLKRKIEDLLADMNERRILAGVEDEIPAAM